MFHNCKMLAIILSTAPMSPSSFLFFSAFIVLQQRTPFLVHGAPLFEHTTPPPPTVCTTWIWWNAFQSCPARAGLKGLCGLCAESARASLADGAPTVRRGKTFWRVNQVFFTKTTVTWEEKVEISLPMNGNERLLTKIGIVWPFLHNSGPDWVRCHSGSFF